MYPRKMQKGLIIQIKIDTVEVSRNVNREVVDMQLIFKDRLGNEFQAYVTDDLVEDMLRQIKLI